MRSIKVNIFLLQFGEGGQEAILDYELNEQKVWWSFDKIRKRQKRQRRVICRSADWSKSSWGGNRSSWKSEPSIFVLDGNCWSWSYERITHPCPRRQREMLQKIRQKSRPKQGEHEQNWSICSHYVSWLSIVHVKAFEGVIEWMWGVLKDTYNKSGGSLGMSKICPCIIRNSLNCSEQWKLISFSI